MADDPANQQQFMEDVAASAAAGGEEGFDPGDSNFKMPNPEELWKMIEQMDGMSDKEKAELKDEIFNTKQAASHSSSDYLIFFGMITIILCIFALFGYKLYKSLMEKELKKQEKLKLKQSKKSKKLN